MAKKNKDTQSTESAENFLKAVYVLQQALPAQEERVATNALSESLCISAPSVTDMAQRLVDEGMIDYQRYKGVRLTNKGEAVALKVLRRHRLIELFLVQELGYPLLEVHDEAENLEHAVSDQFIQAIANKLGNPTFDPHGDPIPTVTGEVAQLALMPLTQLPLQTIAKVSRFVSHDNDMLQYMLDKGFKLQSNIQVVSREPFEGPLTVHLDGHSLFIGYTVADNILVEVAP
jgi:DtxR family Mn-dependent transcriptional regulator